MCIRDRYNTRWFAVYLTWKMPTPYEFGYSLVDIVRSIRPSLVKTASLLKTRLVNTYRVGLRTLTRWECWSDVTSLLKVENSRIKRKLPGQKLSVEPTMLRVVEAWRVPQAPRLFSLFNLYTGLLVDNTTFRRSPVWCMIRWCTSFSRNWNANIPGKCFLSRILCS